MPIVTSALLYRDGADYWFLPTDPPRRSCRGPFLNEHLMRRALHDELGADVAETRTSVRPRFLCEVYGGAAGTVGKA